MPSENLGFKKEKVLMPDGRYLLYYDFNSQPEKLNPIPSQQNKNNAAKEKRHV